MGSVNGVSTARCIIDDTASFLKAGYSKKDLARLATNMAKSVLAASKVGEGKVSVTINGKRGVGTGNEVAKAISGAYVRYGGARYGRGMTLSGGPRTRTLAEQMENSQQAGNSGFKNVLNVYDGFSSWSDRQQQVGTLHEGIHGTSIERAFLSMPNSTYNDIHNSQQSHNKAAEGILDAY